MVYVVSLLFNQKNFGNVKHKCWLLGHRVSNTPPNARVYYNTPVSPVTSTCVSQCRSSSGWIIYELSCMMHFHFAFLHTVTTTAVHHSLAFSWKLTFTRLLQYLHKSVVIYCFHSFYLPIFFSRAFICTQVLQDSLKALPYWYSYSHRVLIVRSWPVFYWWFICKRS